MNEAYTNLVADKLTKVAGKLMRYGWALTLLIATAIFATHLHFGGDWKEAAASAGLTLAVLAVLGIVNAGEPRD